MTVDLLARGDWLAAGCTHMAMESTGAASAEYRVGTRVAPPGRLGAPSRSPALKDTEPAAATEG